MARLPLYMDPSVRPVLVATIFYLTLYYAFMMWGLRIKRRLKSLPANRNKTVRQFIYTTEDAELHCYNRTMGNMLEQMPPFLVSLWLFAIYVDPEQAASLAWFYIVVRAFYPFAFRTQGPWLWAVTFPNYGVIAYFAVTVLHRATFLE